MGKERNLEQLKRAFGRRIRALRKQKELSQMALGERSGLDYNYCGQVERGERNVSLDAIGKLAKGLDVRIADLFVFSSGQVSTLNPELIEILTLLEGRGRESVERVRALVEVVVGWGDDERP